MDVHWPQIASRPVEELRRYRTRVSQLAEVILETIRDHLSLTVTLEEVAGPDGSPVWRASAHKAGGEVWAAEHEAEPMAAVMLAELVGMELEE